MSGPILCSNLPNDQDMIKALGPMADPVPHLYTDALFFGLGNGGAPSVIAVERKKIGDLAQCINDGRFLFQAQGCKDAGVDVMFLIAEGKPHANPDDGLLETPVWGINPRTMHRAEMYVPIKPTMTYSRFIKFLVELEYLAGIVVLRSRDVQETAAIIKAVWDMFQQTPESHKSLHQIFTPPQAIVELVRPGLRRRVAKEFDGVGWQRSRDVAEHFHSVREMVCADAKEWATIPGIGKKIAASVVKEINNGYRS